MGIMIEDPDIRERVAERAAREGTKTATVLHKARLLEYERPDTSTTRLYPRDRVTDWTYTL